ncbi:cation diffusion facilitator family transporter [Salegentibacter sp. F188]|uniref:Cation diffusion facilitator family transporter n=2 Tax=Autumnicola TaxID=3160927 RepID=A0ABU3E4G6_9FLAO|nr:MULTISPECIES: cation diffusion facilitator family transporter [Flavobacteriaceae]MDT0687366.1 cation diffusion facilitator family transporter [Zunongwangia sp. F225]MDT0690893.1 cation diffusion facilitator family transporter [Salegentibacter sp. F188]
MKRSNFTIQKMDCPSEEQMIRMKLETYPQVKYLDFDIPNRKLHVYHLDGIEDIQTSIASLKLGDTLQGTEEAEPPVWEDQSKQKKILWWVLGINFGFFVIEMTTGWISSSMGLIADSLDMLADSIVYALSLFAVGGAISRKKKVAKFSGYFQMALATLGFMEILRRFFSESEIPMFQWMIIVSIFALLGNLISLWLINKAKSKEAHMQASAIFTSNDIIVNGGVILAGVLVYFLDSKWPDLVIGGIVFTFVMRGAIRILKLAK